ncbi:MSCRAMM family protein [Actinoplanes subglobosus]|uniref:Collagen binding domain-containing protein n=1 Tax=Actinoplanes subglobosus TaxID=1547892 RepID=A0ABV8J2I5_9ACTN
MVVGAGLLMAGAVGVPASAAAVGSVAGVFTDHAGAPVADAWVVAWSAADGAYLAGSSTDSAGRYDLAGVPEGGVRLSFQAGTLVQWAPGVLGQEAGRVFPVTGGSTITVDERQRPVGLVEGVVTGADGAPAAWVRVDVRDLAGDSHAYGFTDDAGRYRVGVWVGDHHVGFGPETARQWAPRAVTEDGAGKVAVAAGASVRVDERLLPTGTIRGRLSVAGGGPLPSAEILLYAGDRRIYAGSSDEHGDYSVPVLPGDYVVAFRADPDGVEQFVPGAVDRGKGRVHTVAAGQTVVADDSVLGPASVSGRLVAADGRAQAGFEVFVMSTDDQYSYGATTAADGTWRVDDVHPSDYRVSFTNPAGSRTQWAYGKSTAGGAGVFAVGGGARVTVDDTWLTGATLIVKATDEATGAPVGDFCVEVAAGGGFDKGCSIGGTAIVTDLSPGVATVDVLPGEPTYLLRDEDTPVTLTSGQAATVTVPLGAGGKVTLSSADSGSGAAVEETCFVLMAPGGGGLPDGVGDCTTADGRVTGAAVAPGTYQAFAIAPGDYGHQWVGADGGTGDQQAAARIVVETGRTVVAPAARLDRAGAVTGVVTGAHGSPVADADVSLTAWGFGAGPVHSATTDERGRYRIGKLGPYAWPLSFTTAGHPRQWSGNTGDRFQADRVPVTAGAEAAYDMALTGGPALTGRVTVTPGKPATDWRLTAVNAVTGDPMAEFDSYDQGPDGTYTMPVSGGQPVRIRWSVAGQTGWYAHPIDLPGAGTTRVDVTVG